MLSIKKIYKKCNKTLTINQSIKIKYVIDPSPKHDLLSYCCYVRQAMPIMFSRSKNTLHKHAMNKQHVNRSSVHIYLKHKINMNEHCIIFYFNRRKMSIHNIFQVHRG